MGEYKRVNVSSGRPLEPLANYSRALRCGDMVLQSGTTAIDTEGNIRQLPDGSRWEQDKKGILPSIVEDMLLLRKEYKKLAKEATNEDDKFNINRNVWRYSFYIIRKFFVKLIL